MVNTKARPTVLLLRGLLFNEAPGGDLLSHTESALSSAQLRFTVLFEMGRGGSKALWPPSIKGPQFAEASCVKSEEGVVIVL